jgi:hypothetical protein
MTCVLGVWEHDTPTGEDGYVSRITLMVLRPLRLAHSKTGAVSLGIVWRVYKGVYGLLGRFEGYLVI